MDVNPEYVQKFLTSVEFPASKDDLVDHARQAGADAYIRAAVNELPDRTYDSSESVADAIGQVELGDPPYSADAPTT